MLINRQYTRLWLGQTSSAIGDVVFSSALLIWMGASLFKGESWAPIVTGVVMVAVAATVILVGPVAGVLVDRWDNRRTMMRADLLCTALVTVCTVTVLVSGGPPFRLPVGWLVLVAGMTVVGSTAVAQFFHLAQFVLVRDVVPANRLGRATGYAQTSAAVAMIVGPPLAAVLVTTIGVVPALGLNAVSFVVSYLVVRSIRVPGAVRTPASEVRHELWHEFVDGIAWIRRNRPVSTVIVIAVLSTLGTGALNSLELYFVQDNLGAGARWFGVISACSGAGAIVGALAGGRLGDRTGYTTPTWLTMCVFGLLYIVYSRLTSPLAAACVSLLFGITLGVLNAVALPFLQQAVPRDYLARVGSTLNPLSNIANLLSIAVSGTLVSTVLHGMDVTVLGVSFGAIDTVFLAGGAICFGAGLYAMRMLWNYSTAAGAAARSAGADHGEAERFPVALSASGDDRHT